MNDQEAVARTRKVFEMLMKDAAARPSTIEPNTFVVWEKVPGTDKETPAAFVDTKTGEVTLTTQAIRRLTSGMMP